MQALPRSGRGTGQPVVATGFGSHDHCVCCAAPASPTQDWQLHEPSGYTHPFGMSVGQTAPFASAWNDEGQLAGFCVWDAMQAGVAPARFQRPPTHDAVVEQRRSGPVPPYSQLTVAVQASPSAGCDAGQAELPPSSPLSAPAPPSAEMLEASDPLQATIVAQAPRAIVKRWFMRRLRATPVPRIDRV